MKPLGATTSVKATSQSRIGKRLEYLLCDHYKRWPTKVEIAELEEKIFAMATRRRAMEDLVRVFGLLLIGTCMLYGLDLYRRENTQPGENTYFQNNPDMQNRVRMIFLFSYLAGMGIVCSSIMRARRYRCRLHIQF
mgnify:CR=1 FL=1